MTGIEVSKNPTTVATMFDSIAQNYDLTNTLMTFGFDRLWRRAVGQALRIEPGQRILDLAAGTGSSSAYLAELGADVLAADFSVGMIMRGRELHPDITFMQADAMSLPFADNTFDSVTISFGLRNVEQPQVALKEMLRVTKPGGTLLVCEFSRPTLAPLRRAYEAYLHSALQVLAATAQENRGAYQYLAESILQWPDQQKLAQQIAQVGWEKVEYRNLTWGIVAMHRASKSTN